MKNNELMFDFVKRAKIRCKAIQTLFEHDGYADVVGESQEVVELVSKALLRFLGEEPARSRDVSAQMAEHLGTINSKEKKNLEQLIEISRSLRRDRELSFFGSEDLTPSNFYSKKDAEIAIKSADFAVKFVDRLVGKA